MKRPWFRMHARVKDDAKLQLLPAGMFKSWVNLCCIACEFDGHLPPIEFIAHSLHTSAERALDVISKLSKPPFQLVDRLDSEKFKMHDWDEWQYKSDLSTERVRKHRASIGNVSETLHETFRNAEGETDQRQKQRQTLQKHLSDTKNVPDEPSFDLAPQPTNGTNGKRPKKEKLKKRGNPGWPDSKWEVWCEVFRSDPIRQKSAGAKEDFGRRVKSEEDAQWILEAHKNSDRGALDPTSQFSGSFTGWMKSALDALETGMTVAKFTNAEPKDDPCSIPPYDAEAYR